MFVFILDHDLATANNSIIPPGVKIEITIIRTSSDFYLMKEEDDAEDYRVNIINVWLYVPVGIMTEKMTEEIFMKWQHEPMRYYYDRYTVKTFSIPPKQSQWTTDNIFPESICPTRVFVLLVESDAFLGNQTKNPFSFQRKWVVEEASGLEATQRALDLDSSYLKSKMDEMSQAMLLLVEQNKCFAQFMQKSNANETEESTPDSDESDSESLARKKSRKRPRKDTKTPAKNSKKPATRSQATVDPTSQPSTSRSMLEMFWSKPKPQPPPPQSPSLRSFSVISDHENEHPENPEPQPGSSTAPPGNLNDGPTPKVKQTYFVTKLELDLLNAPLDQLFSEQTIDNATTDYVRYYSKDCNFFSNKIQFILLLLLFKNFIYSYGMLFYLIFRLLRTLNILNRPVTNGISYDNFLSGAYIAAFDLTTSQEGISNKVINTVRAGEFRNKFLF